MTRREQLAQRAADLRAQGYAIRAIAAELGVSRSYAGTLVSDPDGSKERARRLSYGGTCEACGRRTDGANGRAKAPRFCNRCFSRETQLVWTRESVVAAIQEWARRRGRPPISTEWIVRTVDPDGYVFPARASVYDSHNGTKNPAFPSWADAIEAAGFERPAVGRKPRGKGGYLRIPTNLLIAEIREASSEGIAPSSNAFASLRAVLAYRGISWEQACAMAGVETRRTRRLVRELVA